jgi:hypothetical protein
VAPAAAEVDPGAGALGLGSGKGALTKGFRRSAPVAKTSGETAPALSRGEGLGGLLHSAAHCGVERDDGKGEGQSEKAWLTCPLGSYLYPLGLALSYTPCGVRCKTQPLKGLGGE